jgi:hypothetical protein
MKEKPKKKGKKKKRTFGVKAPSFKLHMVRKGGEIQYQQKKQEHNNAKKKESSIARIITS